MLAVLASLALQSAEPVIDFSGVQEPLGGEPTRVLVLGTLHFEQLPGEVFDPVHLDGLLDRLEGLGPDIIAVEAVNGRTCDQIARYPHLYEGVYEDYCRSPEPALEGLGMTQPEADAAAFEMLNTWPEAPSAAERRRLAALLYGAGEVWSAAVQWAHLDTAERIEADGVSAALLERLDRMLTSVNENNLLGVELATRLRLDILTAMDDHTADSVYARAPAALDDVIGHMFSNPPAEPMAVRRGIMDYLGSDELGVPGHRFLNSPIYQHAVVASDFGHAASLPDEGAVARQYVAWWQTRGLRMAANVIEAAGNQPGATVLVIVGAGHKPYFDAYLDQMHDIELLSVDEVLAD
jgi:hypothetical protein